MPMNSTTPVLEGGALVTIASPTHESPPNAVDDQRVVGESLRRDRKSPQNSVVSARCEAEAFMDRLAL
jgi:hypothetical protein